jgi:uncharacterized protein YeaO (DUF488 family)
MIQIKRVYDPPARSHGARFLVDALWPRGLKRQEVKIQGWAKSVAPSKELRQWFGHDPARWPEFQRRYDAELDGKPEAWQPLREAADEGDLTLVFSARDTEHNNAVVLKKYLEKKARAKSRFRHERAAGSKKPIIPLVKKAA